MLQRVEDADVYVVGRTVEGNEFAQAVVVVVFVGQFQDGFTRHLAEPNNGPTDEFLVPFARRYEPRTADARQSLGSRKVEHHFGTTVGLQEGRGNEVGHFALDGAFHDVGAIFTPGHADDTTGRHEVRDTQRDGTAGNILVRIELRRSHVTGIATEQHETARRVELRTRFVEGEITHGTDFAQSQVYTAAGFDLFLVFLAVCEEIFFRNHLAGRVDILGVDIHLVEQKLFQEAHGTGSTFGQGIVFTDVEHDYIREADFSGLIHAHQFGIDRVSGCTRTQSENAMAMLGLAFLNQLGNVVSHIYRTFVGTFEDFGIDLFFPRQSREFQLTVRIVIPFGYTVQFNLRTKICFHRDSIFELQT